MSLCTGVFGTESQETLSRDISDSGDTGLEVQLDGEGVSISIGMSVCWVSLVGESDRVAGKGGEVPNNGGVSPGVGGTSPGVGGMSPGE